MTASITSLKAKKAPLNDQPELATVVSIDPQGRIESISLLAQHFEQNLDKSIAKKVHAQALHIARSAIGDAILVQKTRQGFIVIAQLADKKDSPAAHITDHNGHVKVQGAKSVTLSTAKGTIEVHQDGRIVLDATELSANSERDLTLAGWPIRLN